MESGPIAIFGGFGASNWSNVEPTIGTLDDWVNLTSTVHSLDLKVTSWFNPSYIWTDSEDVQRAFRDAKAAFQGAIDYDELPSDSPARWFRW